MEPQTEQNLEKKINYFVYLLELSVQFVAHAIVTVCFLAILSYIFYKFLPNTNSIYNTYQNQTNTPFLLTDISGYVSGLIFATPIFLVLFYILRKNLLKDVELQAFAARKFVTILACVLSFVVFSISLIVLISTYLSGTDTTASLLTLLSILVVTWLIFTFYLFDIRGNFFNKLVNNSILGGLLLVILALIIYVMVVSGGPGRAKDYQNDYERANRVSSIVNSIYTYYNENKKLPENLNKITLYIKDGLNDPETKQMFDYKVLNTKEYQICANYKTDGNSNGIVYPVDSVKTISSSESGSSAPVYPGGVNIYDHPATYYCYKIDASVSSFYGVSKPTNISVDESLSLIASQYPDFKDYVTDKLPLQSILVDVQSSSIAVAFVQNGSGVNKILTGTCFVVDNNRNVVKTGSYDGTDKSQLVISPSSCK